MTITGRVGTSAVIKADILPANINQHIVCLRLKNKGCLPEYLAFYLNSYAGTILSNRSVTGGTRIALDYSAIKKIKIPLPPLKKQTDIANHINDIRHKAKRLQQEAELELENAKQHVEKLILQTA